MSRRRKRESELVTILDGHGIERVEWALEVTTVNIDAMIEAHRMGRMVMGECEFTVTIEGRSHYCGRERDGARMKRTAHPGTVTYEFWTQPGLRPYVPGGARRVP